MSMFKQLWWLDNIFILTFGVFEDRKTQAVLWHLSMTWESWLNVNLPEFLMSFRKKQISCIFSAFPSNDKVMGTDILTLRKFVLVGSLLKKAVLEETRAPVIPFKSFCHRWVLCLFKGWHCGNGKLPHVGTLKKNRNSQYHWKELAFPLRQCQNIFLLPLLQYLIP